MHVRIVRGRFNPATEGEVQRIISQQITPALHRHPGFQRYLWGINRTTGQVSAMSFWDNEAHANLGSEILARALDSLAALGVKLEPAEIYEVTVEDRAAQVGR